VIVHFAAPAERARPWIEVREGWLEEAGEVVLIGGWAEVAFTDEFAASADTTRYQVFLASYDAVLVFVQNRTQKGFEIHALSMQAHRLPRSTCCAYRAMARRRQPNHA
jgi:hypothetical protein